MSGERRERDLAGAWLWANLQRAAVAATNSVSRCRRTIVRSTAATGIQASAVFAVLVAAYLCSGVIGHDPWKQDEAYTFGMVLNILDTGDWVVPTLGGEPFMEKPPLFYIVAAITADAFSRWLALHDGARLAATLFIAIGLAFTGAAARRLYGADAMPRAVLLLLACFGLLLHAHEMITDTALFAGFAIAVFGLVQATRNPVRAGIFLGTGVGIGFMSKSLVEPAMIGLACAALPVVSRYWRNLRYAKSLATAALFAAPWLLIWPIALHAQNPDAFATWFWVNNFGRYAGTAGLGADTEPWYYTRVLPWFTFPAGPLAVLAVWRSIRARTIRGDSATLLLSVVTVAMLAVLVTAGTARSLYAMPLLIPLALLASQALNAVPQRFIRCASLVFGLLCGAIGLGVWSIWAFGIRFGYPPAVALLLKYLPGDFTFHFQPVFFLLALFCTALWMYVWFSTRRPLTELQRWVAGVTMVWGVTMSLLLPWIDQAKSFREPFSEIATLVPTDACVAGKGLGEPQRGMLHYFAGIVTTLADGFDESCDYLLVQTNKAQLKDPAAPQGWTRIWCGGRDGEENEHFTLYARNELDEEPQADILDFFDLLLAHSPIE